MDDKIAIDKFLGYEESKTMQQQNRKTTPKREKDEKNGPKKTPKTENISENPGFVGKTFHLLPSETALSNLRSPALQLAGFYRTNKFNLTDYRYLINKCNQILAYNEWLMGNLLCISKKIVLNLTPENIKPQNYIIELSNPKIFSQSQNYHEKMESLKEYSVGKTSEIVNATIDGSNTSSGIGTSTVGADNSDNSGNIFNIYFIRDSDNFENFRNLAIIFSISHAVADMATLYRLFNMMDSNTKVYALNRNTVQYIEYLRKETTLCDYTGRDPRLTHGKKMFLPFLVKSWARLRKKKAMKTKASLSVKQRQVDNNQYDYDIKIFDYRLNSKYLSQQKHNLNVEYGQPVSTFHIMTHWLFNFNDKADNIIIPIDLRGKLNHLSKNLAGNYLSAAYLRKDDLATPIDIKMAVNLKFFKSPLGKNCTTYGSFNDFKKYPYGSVVCLDKFYRKLHLPGLELKMLVPVFFVEVPTFYKVKMAVEENMVLFKINDHEHGCYIICGSGRITEGKLEHEEVLGKRIFGW